MQTRGQCDTQSIHYSADQQVALMCQEKQNALVMAGKKKTESQRSFTVLNKRCLSCKDLAT